MIFLRPLDRLARLAKSVQRSAIPRLAEVGKKIVICVCPVGSSHDKPCFVEKFRTYRLPEEVEDVPSDAGGLYHFCLRFPTDYELGLRTPGATAQAIGDRLSKYLTMTAPLFGMGPMNGFARSNAMAKHLQVMFDLKFERVDLARTERLLRKELVRADITTDDLRSTSQALRTAFLAAPPIYIGIAAQQSLRSRLQQHLNGESGVAESLAAIKVSWRYVNFRCTALSGVSETATRSLERIIQALFKPQLSKK